MHEQKESKVRKPFQILVVGFLFVFAAADALTGDSNGIVLLSLLAGLLVAPHVKRWMRKKRSRNEMEALYIKKMTELQTRWGNPLDGTWDFVRQYTDEELQKGIDDTISQLRFEKTLGGLWAVVAIVIGGFVLLGIIGLLRLRHKANLLGKFQSSGIVIVVDVVHFDESIPKSVFGLWLIRRPFCADLRD